MTRARFPGPIRPADSSHSPSIRHTNATLQSVTTALIDSPIVLDRRWDGGGALFTVLGLFRIGESATGERHCVTPTSALPLKALQGAIARDVLEDLDA